LPQMTKIKLDRNNVLQLASEYDKIFSEKSDGKIEKELIGWFSYHKYLDRKNFLKLCMWKSQRPKKHYENKLNSDFRVREITKLAVGSKDEYLKISVLQLLKGVSWPVASVILHFAEPDKYIIMDFRAIWSLGIQQPKAYDFDFWINYMRTVKSIAKKMKVTLRTLDKALWMYSKLNQK